MKCSLINCNKKLSLAQNYQCKCCNIYCSNHKSPESHDCLFDFFKENQINIEKNNKKIIKNKIDKI